MAPKSSYVKEIENYFLSLMGRGIMLSSKDYDLILNWKRRDVPKEIILKGIRKAFDAGLMEKRRNDRTPGLTQSASLIEEEIKQYNSTVKAKLSREAEPVHEVNQIASKLSAIINSEKREGVKKHYIRARDQVMGLRQSKGDDVYKAIEKIEQGFYGAFFESLPKKEQDRILAEAKEKIGRRAVSMTDEARRESMISFRDEILAKEYQLSSISVED